MCRSFPTLAQERIICLGFFMAWRAPTAWDLCRSLACGQPAPGLFCSRGLRLMAALTMRAARGRMQVFLKTFYPWSAGCRICALSMKVFAKVIRSVVMHRKIGIAVVAFSLLAGLGTMSFAQSSTSGGADPKGEGIGSTSSTHNPRPSSPGPTGMEKGKATGSEMGTDTSTHNPSGKPK